MNTGAIGTAEHVSWFGKLGYFLNSTRPDVSEDEVMAALPSIEEVCHFMMTYDDFSCMSQGNGYDLFVLLALVCEKCEQHARGLSYADANLDPRTKGGATLPIPRATMHQIRGRLLVALGRTADAAAAFETAAESASKYGLFLLEMLVLRDFKLSTLDPMGQGEHASRRLGQALRRLRNPESATQRLKGLNAKELLALAAPDATHRVSYGVDDGERAQQGTAVALPEGTPPPPRRQTLVTNEAPELSALRVELQGMRLMPVHARATAEGANIDPEGLDDAMDSANPKAALVRLLLEAAASAAKDCPGAGDGAALRKELEAMRVMALHRRALGEGIDGARVEAAMESEAPKQALVDMLLLKH